MNIGPTIIERLDKATLSRRRGLNRKYNHASEIGWASVCMRHLVLLREHPDKQDEPEIALLRKFEECQRQERLVAEELSQAEGIEVVDAGADKEVLLIPEFETACELDLKIRLDGSDPLITEVKSCDPGFFRLVKQNFSGLDFAKSKSFYLRLYPPQLWMQMLARKEGEGQWFCKNRSDGDKHIIYTTFAQEGMDIMGKTLEKITQVNEMVKKGVAPDAVPCEGCTHCSFHNYCFEEGVPQPNERIEIVKGGEMEAVALRWRELKAKVDPLSKDIKELEKIEKNLKDIYRGRNVIIGDVLVKVKSRYQMKVYDIPEEIKDKYMSLAEVMRMTIEDLGKSL